MTLNGAIAGVIVLTLRYFTGFGSF